MKLVIDNRDIDNPNETKEVSPVDLDLDETEQVVAPQAPDFSVGIAQAAAAAAQATRQAEEKDRRRQAQAALEQGLRALAEQVEQDFDLSVGYDKPWVYKAKPKAAYALWKKVVPMFVQDPHVLTMGPTKLAAMLDRGEPNYTVTRDMMYDALNFYAKRDVTRLLQNLGVTLALKEPVSIRSIQKQLIERESAASGQDAEEFSGHFAIRGGMAYVNGKPYKVQLGASGKRRIKIGGRDWLPLDTLKAFCSAGD